MKELIYFVWFLWTSERSYRNSFLPVYCFATVEKIKQNEYGRIWQRLHFCRAYALSEIYYGQVCIGWTHRSRTLSTSKHTLSSVGRHRINVWTTFHCKCWYYHRYYRWRARFERQLWPFSIEIDRMYEIFNTPVYFLLYHTY